MNFNKIKYTFLLFFILPFICKSQINTPEKLSLDYSTIPKILDFNRNDFQADPQFWTMCEDNDGMFIFGNNDGALIFDGEHWHKISLPNNSSIRSLIKTPEGKIYAGGYNEFGTLQKDKYGKYYYKSLISKFHLEGKNLENLWKVDYYKKSVVFRAFNELIIISGNSITQLPASNSFIYSGIVNSDFYVQDGNKGLFKLNIKTMDLSLVFNGNEIDNDLIACMMPSKDPNVVFLITAKGSVYLGNIITKKITKQNSIFNNGQKDQILCGITNGNDGFLLGTLSSKIIKVAENGQVNFDDATYTSINNASIHCLYRTENNNIWILKNNGLNYLDYKSPFVSIFNQASVYDIAITSSKLYIGTNKGVYYSDLSSKQKSSFLFNKIDNSQGQVWSVQDFDNTIIVSHNDGLFKVEGNILKKIGAQAGFWKISKIKNKKGWYLGSNYYGLYLIEQNDDDWKIVNKISGFDESTRDILADKEPNTYWVCHGYKGVYKIHINESYNRVVSIEHFTNQNGFKSAFNINVFNWKGKTIFTTNNGIFRFNSVNKLFEPYQYLNNILNSSKNTRKIKVFQNKTWFVQDDEVGYFVDNVKTPFINKDLFLDLKGSFNRGMECIYPIANDKVFFGTNNGLYFYNIIGNHKKNTLPTIISQIYYVQNQKVNYLDYNSNQKSFQLPNQTDILRIEFAAPKMISSSKVQYSYKLESIDENWSQWQPIAFKEYTHLRPGSYKFIVKSRTLHGLSGKEVNFEFSILPLWYQTNLAYFIYFTLIILFVRYLIKYMKNKIAIERLKSKMEIEKSQKLLELELEKLKLREDQEKINEDRLHLEEDIISKSKELANYTLLLSQKKDSFIVLQEDLKQLRDLLKSDDSRRKISEIFQKLNQYKIGEEYMEIFDVNFEKIHHDFFEKLKQIAPSLTKRELRLCAFIKMDLSNKEISPLLGISIRGIETARYKVRKKLNINHDENFNSFFEKLIL